MRGESPSRFAAHVLPPIPAPARRLQTTHAQSGVDKGVKGANAMPVEVMGLMHGHVDTDDPHAIIVTDVRG
jgi:hypothetical protein